MWKDVLIYFLNTKVGSNVMCICNPNSINIIYRKRCYIHKYTLRKPGYIRNSRKLK